MSYNFDEKIDRRQTNALSTDGYGGYLFKDGKAPALPCAEEEVIRMWVADMEFAAPPAVLKALRERLERRIFGYTKVFDPRYKEVFLQWAEKRYRWSCSAEHLVFSSGVIPALNELVGLLSRPGEKILFLTPSYAFFQRAVDFNQREAVYCDLVNENRHYSLDLEDFARTAADPLVTVFILCHPHNPTGRIWSRRELRQMAEICLENNLSIISDEVHCDLLRHGLQHIPLASLFPGSERIVTCMAPSKTFNLAGMMFSNIIIPGADLREAWQKRNFGLQNPFSIAAAQAAYGGGAEWLDALRLYLDDNFRLVEKFLAERLPEARFQIPQATYLAWIDLRRYFAPGDSLAHFFATKAGVILEDGPMFVRNGEGHIRLNLACPRALVSEALERMARVLEER